MFTVHFLSMILACADEPQTKEEPVVGDVEQDIDGDGYLSEDDCDENDSSVNINAEEICDGLDNNCDGQVDEGVTTTYYSDADQDGYGNPNSTTEACSIPSGYSATGTDCNDVEPLVFPGNDEVCDGIDNDCNSFVDDEDLNLDLYSAKTYYVDADGDGFGDINNSILKCDISEGIVEDTTDCDDTNSNISPSSSEMCDGIDNDGQFFG